MRTTRKWHGDYWTQGKLQTLDLFNQYFTKEVNDRGFNSLFVDACAGESYVERRNPRRHRPGGFFQLSPNLLDGSSRRALKLNVPFDQYVFIEKDKGRFEKLRRVRIDFPALSKRIRLCRGDANYFVPRICKATDWNETRAVFFLDPPGTQIRWETVQAIASTGAADLWYLFPVGQAVNRLLTHDRKNLKESHRATLNATFGSDISYDTFYRPVSQACFGVYDGKKVVTKMLKWVEPDDINRYFAKRLKGVFKHVVERPVQLINRTGVQLYSLFFASPIRRRAEKANEIMRRYGAGTTMT